MRRTVRMMEAKRRLYKGYHGLNFHSTFIEPEDPFDPSNFTAQERMDLLMSLNEIMKHGGNPWKDKYTIINHSYHNRFYDRKRCDKCHRLLPKYMFYPDDSSIDGLRHICRDCERDVELQMKEHGPYYQWAMATISSHKSKGVTVDISIRDLVDLAVNAKYCPICGRRLELGRGLKKYDKNGYLIDRPKHEDIGILSVDRINNEMHMNKDNVMIICRRCNSMKGDRTMHQFIRDIFKMTYNMLGNPKLQKYIDS